MNFIQQKPFFKIVKTIVRSVCIFAAVFSLVLFSGCDLFTVPDEKEDEVVISQSSAEIRVGATVTLVATSSENRTITWVSSDEEIATVDDGKVTGISAGVSSITANDGKKMATCEVTVIPVQDDSGGEEGETKVTVTLSQSRAEIKAGASITLIVTVSDGSAVSWFTSDEKIATVDANGVVTGVKAGTARITVTNGHGAGAGCEVTVLEAEGKELVWCDEFEGNALDMTKWGYQTGTQDHYGNSYGPQYWGNGELQYYTDGANVRVADGALQITAKRQNMGDRTFTSARIATRDKFSQTYGYFEARIKAPAIEGLWPAFWMLPQPTNASSSDNVYGGWPDNGEIDIMEAKGRLLNKVDCTLHFGNTWQQHDYAGTSKTLGSNIDEWHTYAVDWREDYIAWIVDGEEVYKVSSSRWWTGASEEKTAPFDKPFYVLINLAVGGQYDSYREPPEGFTQGSMYVDYVRIYR